MKKTALVWCQTLVSGAVIGVVGTFTYRLGAAYNIPYGLVVTLLVVGALCLLSGGRGGKMGLWHEFVHAFVSTAVTWGIALASTQSSSVVAMGGSALTTFWSLHASIVWLYGIFLVQFFVMFLPASLRARFTDEQVSQENSSQEVGE
ncbi:hypothetical protein B9G54_05255 [Alloscardovia macacae]|uniref:Alcohol dehydrogenase n=1 Tax=Alloscardovia macacae TaxID=1160091 RepID=A0A1Y2SZN2_9BIFI|nr:hypothetical protein [Alloscardovia macacae]OTA26389.1 hypothetical protein B9G54_05255 [Alloscardovia macacae]OTA28805.1 hypothetical protein B9T39_05625 [Alloscardovia macacae]